jgi:hypothetical protein
LVAYDKLRALRCDMEITMKSSLRERLGRLGPIRVIPRTDSGSPADASISAPDDLHDFDTVASIILLHTQAGLTMIQAKRLVETLLKLRFVDIRLPKVLDAETLQTNLLRAGLNASINSLRTEADEWETSRRTAPAG